MRVVTFKIEEELLDKVDLYAFQNGMVRSEVIRRALKWYLRNPPRIIRTKRLVIY